jgi:hypothetical protein
MMSSPAKKQKTLPPASIELIMEGTDLNRDVANIIDDYWPKLYLYILSHEDPSVDYAGNSFFLNCIVVASTPEIAKTVHPMGFRFSDGDMNCDHRFRQCNFHRHHSDGQLEHCNTSDWPNSLDVIEIGISTDKNHKEGDVILDNYLQDQ